MKKVGIVLLCGLLLCLAGCAVSKETTDSRLSEGDSYWDALDGFQGTAEEYVAHQGVTTTTATTTAPSKKATGADDFIRPAEAVSLDLSKNDPSCSAMKLSYDSTGRIAECHYTVNGIGMSVYYAYDHGMLSIKGYCDNIAAAQVEYALDGEYNSAIGFSVFKGYYLKGYEM